MEGGGACGEGKAMKTPLMVRCLSLFAITIVCPSSPTSGAPGDISTVAGTGTSGYTGDGGDATLATLSDPMGVAVDSADNLYIVDLSNHCIRRVDDETGVITTVAGTGAQGYNGDGIAATAAQLNYPFGMAFDAAGNLYIADSTNHRVRRVDIASGIISTIAGTGVAGFSGDGGPATAAQLRDPVDLAFDPEGNLHIAELRNQRVRRIDAVSGVITTIAGTGTQGYNGDGIAATSADLFYPSGIAFDRKGHLFIGDTGNDRVRRVDAVTGLISTYAGTGTRGFDGDGGAATAARIAYVAGVGLDGAGNLFIADQDNHRVRRVDTDSGVISTVAGTGSNGYSGDGGPAIAAQLYYPYDVAVDSRGHLYIADPNNDRVRRVESAGEFPVPFLTVTKPKNFPTTKLGRTSRPQTVVIGNTGSGDLTGIGVSLSGSHRRDFRVSSAIAATLEPGDSTRLLLSFRPKASGLRKATLSVGSGNGGTVVWPLKGRGK